MGYNLTATKRVLEIMMPQSSLVSDGLIFQGKTDPYVPGAYDKLIKWKLESLNSVDVFFRSVKQNEYELSVQGRNGKNILIDTEVLFPSGHSDVNKDGCVIECTYDRTLQKLIFMRV